MSPVRGERARSGFVLALLITMTLVSARPEAQTSSTLGRANTWAARSSSGLTLAGTWTATEDPKTGAVTGNWTLIGAQGRVAGRGGWSAVKSPSGWSGGWRAVAVGRSGEYSGTWTARVDLQPTTKLHDLFAKAIETAISGTWQAGRQSGAWTIQAFK
jgi:hypothetical protein